MYHQKTGQLLYWRQNKWENPNINAFVCNLFPIRKALPKVPETLLKKRKQNAELRANRARAVILNKKKQLETRRDIFKRAEKYVREYKKAEQDGVRLRRLARKTKNFYVPAMPKLAIVIRIRGWVIWRGFADFSGSVKFPLLFLFSLSIFLYTTGVRYMVFWYFL